MVGFDKKIDENIAKDIAMQIAAMNPIAIDKDSVSEDTINKEIEIGKDLAKQEGKPENMLDKIALGRLNKFFKENTLLSQAFIKDQKCLLVSILHRTLIMRKFYHSKELHYLKVHISNMKYKRILLKLSGESLMGNENYGIDYNMLSFYSKQIKLISKNIQIAIVIGGGNIYRGDKSKSAGFDRVQGDYMGMLATIINGIALQSALEEGGFIKQEC